MKKLPILFTAALIAVSFCGSVKAQSLEIQLNSRTYTNGYDVSCHGAQNGSIEAICINGQEPYAYVWSNGATTQTINNVAAGTYTVTVYDWNNNSGQKEITLREPEVLETFLTADECGGGTNICQQGASTGHIYSEIRGGSPPYTYLWNTGSESQTIDGVPAGTYTLTVTDINGCTSAQNITLTEPSALHIVSITSPLHHGFNVSCIGQSDGAINLNVAGGVPPYSFQWNNGSMDQNPQALEARVYMVKVYDQNGAMVTGQLTLTQPPAINIVMTPSAYSNGFNLSAFNSLDGSITTNVTGGAAPYTYSWQTLPVKTTANLSNISAGGYELRVYDANGCVGNAYSDLRQPERDDWTMNGNYGTNPAYQFIGTSDYTDLSFRTNNTERLKITANGEVKINSSLDVKDFILFNGNSQIGYRAAQGTNPEIMSFGKAPVILPPAVTMCTNTNLTPSTFQFNGILQSYGTATNNGVSKTNAMIMGFDGSNSIIDAAGSSPYPNGNTLLLNYYCGHDVIAGNSTSGDLIANHNLRVSGKTGLGTNTPYNKLDVAGGVAIGSYAGNNPPAPTNGMIVSGKIGIGIASLNPQSMLHVKGEGRFENANISSTDATRIGFYSDGIYNAGYVDASADLWLNHFSNHNITLGGNNSRVGIGTISPSAKLHVKSTSTNLMVETDHNYSFGYNTLLKVNNDATKALTVLNSNYNGTNNEVEVFQVWGDGRVAIGGDSYIPGGYSLAVHGNAIVNELVVRLAGDWPDYVFKSNYKIKTLDEINDYIIQHHHLPGIPTSNEIEKSGIALGDLVTKQMQKIEELTLYLIELNKDVQVLKKENEILKAKINNN